PGVAVGDGDPEDVRRALAVQVEQHAERDHLALTGRQLSERLLQRRRQAAEEAVLGRRPVQRIGVLAAPAALLGTGVVEGGGAREWAEPGARAPAPRVDPPPLAQRPLEGLGSQVLGEAP